MMPSCRKAFVTSVASARDSENSSQLALIQAHWHATFAFSGRLPPFRGTGEKVRPSAPTRLLGHRPVGLGIDQHARIEQAMRIQGHLGRPEGSGKQWWALAIVPRPMVAPDRMMVSDRAAVLDHGIQAGRLDGVPLRDQLSCRPAA